MIYGVTVILIWRFTSGKLKVIVPPVGVIFDWVKVPTCIPEATSLKFRLRFPNPELPANVNSTNWPSNHEKLLGSVCSWLFARFKI